MNFQPNPQYYAAVPQVTGAENMLQHGYIGLSFGSHTESFFASVLKTSPRYLQVGFNAPGWATAFYIDPINNIAVPANAMSSRGYLIMVLDYRADLSRGTIIPQIPWFPQTPRDVRKYVTDSVLQLPIFLRQDDGTIGMSLSDVVHGNFRRLVDSVRQVNVGGRTSVHIRINVSVPLACTFFFFKPCSFPRQKWPGYNEWKRQFQTRDETPNRNPITIEKFVRHIGRSVDKFMSVSSLHFFRVCYFCRIQFIDRGFRVPFRNCTKQTLGGESGSMESPATTSFWSALYTSRRAAGCPSYSSIADYSRLTPEFHMTGNQHRLPRSSNNDFGTFKSICVDSMWASVPLYHYCTCARSWASFINRTQSDHLAIQTTTHRLCRLSTC